MSKNIYDINFNNFQELVNFLLNSKPCNWQSKIILQNKNKFIQIKPWCKTLGEVRYCIKHNINEQPLCKNCNKPTRYVGDYYGGYTKCCSLHCQNQFKLKDIHYTKDITDEQLKNILINFCNNNHPSSWNIYNKKINMYAKNILERTNFLPSTSPFRERMYYISNNLYERKMCHVCNTKPLLWLSNNTYSKTCGCNDCKIKQRNMNQYNIIVNNSADDKILKRNKLLDIINNSNKKFCMTNKSKELINSIKFYTQFLDENASMQERIYCLKNNIIEQPKCKECGKFLEWNGSGYFKFCSAKCASKNINTISKTNQTMMERYGITRMLQSKSYRAYMLSKILKCNNSNITNISQIESIKLKKINTLMKKWGVINSFHTPKAKINLKKYYDTILTTDCYLYVLYCKSLHLIKIGITNKIDRRINEIKNSSEIDNIKLLYSLKSSKNTAFRMEYDLHKKYKYFNYILDKGDGRTEWFSDNCVNNVLKDIKRFEKCLNI